MRRVACVRDVWTILPLISLLILPTDGSLQTHHDYTTVPADMQKLANQSSNETSDNRTEEAAIGGPKRWKRETFEEKMGGSSSSSSSNKEAIDSRYIASEKEILDTSGNDANVDEYEQQGTDSNFRTVSKGTKAAESQFGLPTKPEEFPKISQERSQPWPYWWGGKRQSLYSPSISNIRRPIRVPFNSWGGKRGYAYSLLNLGTHQIKRTKQTFDRNDRDASVDGSNEVKRVAEISKVGCRTPFDSWGGKRTEKSLLSPDDATIFDPSKRGFVEERNMADTTREEKHPSRGRNDISDGRDSSNGKWNYLLRAILPWMCNKTRQDGYTSEEDEDSNANNWIHDYRKERKSGNNDKRTFDPWGGKRSLKVYTVRFGNGYSAMPVRAMPLDGYK